MRLLATVYIINEIELLFVSSTSADGDTSIYWIETINNLHTQTRARAHTQTVKSIKINAHFV